MNKWRRIYLRVLITIHQIISAPCSQRYYIGYLFALLCSNWVIIFLMPVNYNSSKVYKFYISMWMVFILFKAESPKNLKLLGPCQNSLPPQQCFSKSSQEVCVTPKFKGENLNPISVMINDSVFGERVLTYWENRGNINHYHLNIPTVHMGNHTFLKRR